MNRALLDIIASIFFLVCGLACALFYKRFANETVNFYLKYLKKKYDTGPFEIGFLLGGVALALFELLSLFGFIKFK